MKKKLNINKICIAGICLSIGLILPFITGQIREIGNMLCPMHIPVILCGYICGPLYGLIIGIITPIIRSLIFTAPSLYPLALSMAVELGIYGFISGLLYKLLVRKTNKQIVNIIYIYISLIVALILGRIGWGLARYLLTLIDNTLTFTKEMFISGALLLAWPGIIIQLIIIPIIITTLTKKSMIPLKETK